MPRQPRQVGSVMFYHVLNRAAGRFAMFRRDEDYAAFERIMLEAAEKFPLRIVDWCLMKNHWHFVVWPERAEELTDYFRWLTHTHAMRFRVAHHSVGWGHLYQGRFKAFPVEEGGPLRMLRRYVQRNALTAGGGQAGAGLALGEPMGAAGGVGGVAVAAVQGRVAADAGVGELGERAVDA